MKPRSNASNSRSRSNPAAGNSARAAAVRSARDRSGSVSAVMRPSVASVTARSTRFSSSRTLPGKLCAVSAAIASASTPVIACACSAENFFTKWSTSSGTSSRRSRSGGMRTWITFRR